MAARIATAAPLKGFVRVAAKTGAPYYRQFTCSAVRAKDVASQEDVPNMRHAQRPRE